MTALEQRFWSKVDKTGECWIWMAAKNNRGYGVVGIDGKLALAHRVAYEMTRPIPTGMVIDHTCHTPLCVNPSHLQAVTQAENMFNRKSFQSNSKTKIRGVFWNSQKQKYQAKVRHRHVGFFDNLSDAESAVVEARREA